MSGYIDDLEDDVDEWGWLEDPEKSELLQNEQESARSSMDVPHVMPRNYAVLDLTTLVEDQLSTRKKAILDLISHTQTTQALANLLHQLPKLCVGLNDDQSMRERAELIEKKRNNFKVRESIVAMTMAERDNYLVNARDPFSHLFAQVIQHQVQQELHAPTIPLAKDVLKTLHYGVLHDLKIAVMKTAHFLYNNQRDNWQYSLFVELNAQLSDKLIATYTDIIPALSELALKEKIALLKQEKTHIITTFGLGTAYEATLNKCIAILAKGLQHYPHVHLDECAFREPHKTASHNATVPVTPTPLCHKGNTSSNP